LRQATETGPWRVDLRDHRQVALKLAIDEPWNRGLMATEVAALAVAADHDLPAPRVLAADVSGAEAGQPALVTTWLDGSSAVPNAVDPARARALGHVAAAIHSVRLEPTDALPVRRSSLETVPFETIAVPERAQDLLASVRSVVAGAGLPAWSSTLVHGDLWQGNTLWSGGVHTGTLDWDHAGVGHPLIDLGSLRWDLAVLGGGGHDDLVAGWSEATGTTLSAEDVARGDLVAVTASAPDLALWLPNFHAQGRTDLTLDVVTSRRDAFAGAALALLR
jgi:aminoglycoside phosphotransferase (APT) family kinase protein